MIQRRRGGTRMEVLMQTWVVEMVRRRSMRRLSAWLLTAATVLLLMLSQQRYVRNFVSGPYVLAAADLDAVTDVRNTPRVFVNIAGSRAIDTGLQQITIQKNHGVETSR